MQYFCNLIFCNLICQSNLLALASFGFTAVFALVSLFSGSVSDRYDRNVIAGTQSFEFE